MYAQIYKKIFLPFYETILRGRKTLVYLKEFEKNQWLSQEELKKIQWDKLKKILQHAYKHIPYYQQQFERVGFNPESMRSMDDFFKIPFLTKRDIQSHQETLVADNYRNEKLFDSWTGGSTGEPIHFKYDHRTYELRVASTARIDRWAGWDFGVKEFYVWGVRPRPEPKWVTQKRQLHNFLLRRRIISSYLFSEKTFPEYLKIYNSFKPDVMIVYTSSLYNFARYIKDNQLQCHSPKSIIATAEQLFPHQRRLFEEVFRCPVFNRYGSREFMNIGMECEKHEGLHLNIDNLFVEILQNGQPVKPGELGEIVVTDLNNYAMPFIRYQTGDLAVLADKPCSCGRGMPILKQIFGRLFDTLMTKDGKCVTGLFFTHLMHEFTGVNHFQIVQKTIDHVIVRIVKNNQYQNSDTLRIEQEIKKLMGENLKIDFEFLTVIPQQASGKTRITICEVPHELNVRVR